MNSRDFHEEMYGVPSSSSSSSASDSDSMGSDAADVCSRSKAHRERRSPRRVTTLAAPAGVPDAVSLSFSSSQSSVVVIGDDSSCSSSDSSSSDSDDSEEIVGFVASEGDAMCVSEDEEEDEEEGEDEEEDEGQGEDEDEEQVVSEVKGDEAAADDESQQVMYKGLEKLCRGGGRYFDPMDVTTRCFNCGRVGHVRQNCTEEKKRSPCFLCGQLGHSARRCTTAANDTPAKQFCWMCSDSSHATHNCKYPERRYRDRSQNLHLMHCYVCGNLGHYNCCSDPISWFIKKRPSCCNCGKFDHTYHQCIEPRMDDLITDEQALGYTVFRTSPTPSCFACGELGHLARQCPARVRGRRGSEAGGTSRRRTQTMHKQRPSFAQRHGGRHGNAQFKRRTKSMPAKQRLRAVPKARKITTKKRRRAQR